jgi:Phage major capsid protein E
MATIRSFDKPFEMVDLTEELNLIPNTWGLINELGLFRPEGITQHSVSVEAYTGTLSVIGDAVRGARNFVNKDDTRNIRSFPVPHFPADDQITPSDLQGKRAYGVDQADTEAAVVARKLERIRRNHAVTMEAGRAYAITTGAIYAPNLTVVDNYYTSFNITRLEIDAVLGTSTTDVVAKIEQAIASIQDNITSGEVVNSVTALCSPVFFAKLIAHAKVTAAFQYYSSTQEPLRNRLGSGVYRRFSFGGCDFIEYRGSFNGTALIPSGDAYFFPMGTQDTFISYFSPANKLSLTNTVGEPVYAFQYRDPKDEGILLQSECNQLHLVRRPQAIVRMFSSN